jgi:hypothetical protein
LPTEPRPKSMGGFNSLSPRPGNDSNLSIKSTKSPSISRSHGCRYWVSQMKWSMISRRDRMMTEFPADVELQIAWRGSRSSEVGGS